MSNVVPRNCRLSLLRGRLNTFIKIISHFLLDFVPFLFRHLLLIAARKATIFFWLWLWRLYAALVGQPVLICRRRTENHDVCFPTDSQNLRVTLTTSEWHLLRVGFFLIRRQEAGY